MIENNYQVQTCQNCWDTYIKDHCPSCFPSPLMVKIRYCIFLTLALSGLVLLMLVLSGCGQARAEYETYPDLFQAKEKDEKPVSLCPVSKMKDQCLTCHTVNDGKFVLKEFPPDSHLVYPTPSMKIMGWEINKKEQLYGYFALRDIDAEAIMKFFNYLRLHKINRALIEIYSPGGGLFSAQKIVSLIEEFQAQGGIVETRTDGAAFSASFYVFVAGSLGHRYVNPFAELMWHELQSLTGFGFVVDTPSSSEEKARVLKHLQKGRNVWLATKGKLSEEQLNEKIKNQEFWMTGAQAVEYGFADKFIGVK